MGFYYALLEHIYRTVWRFNRCSKPAHLEAIYRKIQWLETNPIIFTRHYVCSRIYVFMVYARIHFMSRSCSRIYTTKLGFIRTYYQFSYFFRIYWRPPYYNTTIGALFWTNINRSRLESLLLTALLFCRHTIWSRGKSTRFHEKYRLWGTKFLFLACTWRDHMVALCY